MGGTTACGRATVAGAPAIRGDRVALAGELARGVGAPAVLLSSRATLRWLGAGGARHVLASGGEAVALVPHGVRAPAGTEVERFEPARREALAEALSRALLRADVRPTEPVAVEAAELPSSLAHLLGEPQCRDVGAAVVQARAVKDAEEVALIACAAALAAAGQEALREGLAPGLSEQALWGRARCAMSALAGGPVEASVDLMTGARTALVGVPPGPALVAPGDAVLFDLAPCRDGYWGDSCATFACGPPSRELRRRHAVALRALECGLRFARPGAIAGELDRAMRDVLAEGGLTCPHHMGHGVGTAPQEVPWIVPGAATVLEAGMVVALEPGAYADGFGLRLEHVAVIEADGARPLTTHSLDL